MPVIGTNIAAMIANRYLNKNTRLQAESLNKISSGMRIVRASDDAAGLAVSSRMQSDITTLQQGEINAIQGQSVLQTADGALARIGDIMARMRALATAANSGQMDVTTRGYLQTEFTDIGNEINATGVSTQFNGMNLIDGTYNYDYQVGTDASSDTITADLSTVKYSSFMAQLGNSGASHVSTQPFAVAASNYLKGAIDNVSRNRSLLGSIISRFTFRGDVINTSIESLQGAKSAIRDVDIAGEQTNLTSLSVLTESSIAAVTQANKLGKNLLSLMK